MTKRGAAWSKQKPATMVAICDALRLGVPIARAAKLAGISESTFQNWRSAGWEAIESAADDSTEPLPFVAKFAIAIESAQAEFMKPFLERISDETRGDGKGDWRAARAILEMRFPHEFSEKVHAAKSARLEVSGTVAVEHEHSYREFLNFRKMSALELQFEIERLSGQIDHGVIKGDELAAEIVFLQAKLAAMIEAHDTGRSFNKSNWIAGRGPAVRAVAPPTVPSPAEPPIIDVEEYISDQAANSHPLDMAPITAGGAALTGAVPSATPSEPARVPVGFGFSPARGTVPIYADEVDVGFDDEDLSL